MLLGTALRGSHSSGPDSPPLKLVQSLNDDAGSDYDDDYDDHEYDRDQEMRYNGTWGDGDEANNTLPEPALGLNAETETGDHAPQDGPLPRDIQRRTTFYDYAAEKQTSFADAKLFYQRSQMEAQRNGESAWGSQASPAVSPILAARTYSNLASIDNAGLHRTGSSRSVGSELTMAQK